MYHILKRLDKAEYIQIHNNYDSVMLIKYKSPFYYEIKIDMTYDKNKKTKVIDFKYKKKDYNKYYKL